jgi:recombination protein RecT
MGLSLTPNMGEAYILPTELKGKQVARLEIGYKGYISMAKRSGIKSVEAEVVRKGDTFAYTMGLNPTLVHVRNSQFSDPMTHAYAKAKIDGEWVFRVLDEKEILHAKSKSKSARSEYSPWNTHPESMWKKTAIKRLLNSQSLSSELNALVGYDTNDEVNKAEPMIDIDEPDYDDAPAVEVQDIQDVDLPE